jgi:hypothetical protein
MGMKVGNTRGWDHELDGHNIWGGGGRELEDANGRLGGILLSPL